MPIAWSLYEISPLLSSAFCLCMIPQIIISPKFDQQLLALITLTNLYHIGSEAKRWPNFCVFSYSEFTGQSLIPMSEGIQYIMTVLDRNALQIRSIYQASHDFFRQKESLSVLVFNYFKTKCNSMVIELPLYHDWKRRAFFTASNN